jgi:putative FmdB family regulatory protein
MPIYEFRCLACGDLFELLVMAGGTNAAIQCTHCGAQGGERVLSLVSHTVGDGGSPSGQGPGGITRSCGSGSCGTITLPGHTR